MGNVHVSDFVAESCQQGFDPPQCDAMSWGRSDPNLEDFQAHLAAGLLAVVTTRVENRLPRVAACRCCSCSVIDVSIRVHSDNTWSCSGYDACGHRVKLSQEVSRRRGAAVHVNSSYSALWATAAQPATGEIPALMKCRTQLHFGRSIGQPLGCITLKFKQALHAGRHMWGKVSNDGVAAVVSDKGWSSCEE